MAALKAPAREKAGPQMPAAVAAAFAAHSPAQRAKLLRLRKIILATAAKMDGIGALAESLKWGQPSYRAKTGSSVRVGMAKDGRCALYFICHTDLVATFRELYPGLAYEGDRAILFGAREKLPEDALRHCISLALSYGKGR